MKSRKPSESAQIALLVVAMLAVAAAGYFLVLAPKRAATADVKSQVEATQVQIDTLRAAVANPPPAPPPPVDVAELFRLTKAMPDRADMPSMILELNRIAKDTGIVFESIGPGAPTPGAGFQIVPVSLAFEGNFYNLADFLYRLRSLVAVRDGKLSANGRLFNVKSVTFGPGTDSFPQLKASVTVNAFVYGDGSVPAPPVTEVPPPAAPTTPEGGTPAPAEPQTVPPATVSAAPAAGGAS